MNGCEKMAKNSGTSIDEQEQRTINIAAHNYQITAQINACNELKGKYQTVSSNASSIMSSIDSFIESLREINTLLEKVVISGEPVGKGDISKDCSALEGIKGVFGNIITACNEKISELDKKIAYLRTQ